MVDRYGREANSNTSNIMKRNLCMSEAEQPAAQCQSSVNNHQRVVVRWLKNKTALEIGSNTGHVKTTTRGASCIKLKLGHPPTKNTPIQAGKPPTNGSLSCPRSHLSGTAKNRSGQHSQTSVKTPRSVDSKMSPSTTSNSAKCCAEVTLKPQNVASVQRCPCAKSVNSVHTTCQQSTCRNTQQLKKTIASPKCADPVNSGENSRFNLSKNISCQNTAVISRPPVMYSAVDKPSDDVPSSRTDKNFVPHAADASIKSAKLNKHKPDAAAKVDACALKQGSGVMKKKNKKKRKSGIKDGSTSMMEQAKKTPLELCSLKKKQEVTNVNNKAGRFIHTFTPSSARNLHHSEPDVASEEDMEIGDTVNEVLSTYLCIRSRSSHPDPQQRDKLVLQ